MAARPGGGASGSAVALCALTGCGGALWPHSHMRRLDQRPGARAASAIPWLGSTTTASPTPAAWTLRSRGIVYHREGDIEVNTGVTTQNGLSSVRRWGPTMPQEMIPVIEIDPAIGPPDVPTPPMRTRSAYDDGRADRCSGQGSVITAASVLHAFPGRAVLFELFDEPWNWGSPPGTIPSARAASEYAAVIAQILPRPRVGRAVAGHLRRRDRIAQRRHRWVGECTAPAVPPAGPGRAGPSAAVASTPTVFRAGSARGSARSRRSVPRCARGRTTSSSPRSASVPPTSTRGALRQENRTDIDGTSARAAAWLTRDPAAGGRDAPAGWLKALLVWSAPGPAGRCSTRTERSPPRGGRLSRSPACLPDAEQPAYVITYACMSIAVVTTDPAALGARVRALREAMDLSLRDLALRSRSARRCCPRSSGARPAPRCRSRRESPPASSCGSRSSCDSTRTARSASCARGERRSGPGPPRATATRS